MITTIFDDADIFGNGDEFFDQMKKDMGEGR